MSTDPRLRKNAALASTESSSAVMDSPTPTITTTESVGEGEIATTEIGAGEVQLSENVQPIISIEESTPIDLEMASVPGIATEVKAEPTNEVPSTLPLRLSSEQIEAGMFDTPPPSTRALAADLNAIPVPTASTSAHAVPVSVANPLSRVAQLMKRIELNPLDGEARLARIVDAESKGDLERTREIYEDFLKVFPDAVNSFLPFLIQRNDLT